MRRSGRQESQGLGSKARSVDIKRVCRSAGRKAGALRARTVFYHWYYYYYYLLDSSSGPGPLLHVITIPHNHCMYHLYWKTRTQSLADLSCFLPRITSSWVTESRFNSDSFLFFNTLYGPQVNHKEHNSLLLSLSYARYKASLRRYFVASSLFFLFSFFFSSILGFEFRAYTLNHSTSLLLWWVFLR
jgi:hypothetical protein